MGAESLDPRASLMERVRGNPVQPGGSGHGCYTWLRFPLHSPCPSLLTCTQGSPVWKASMTGPANESTEDAETLRLLWKPNLEIYGLQVN